SELSIRELRTLTKSFTEKMLLIIGPDIDILAPDMGTSEREMGWMFEIFTRTHGYQPGVVTGKPVELGGLCGRNEATGKGVAFITSLAANEHDIDLNRAKIAIQGFGKVGGNAARYLD